jgi:hypothetical protein
VWRRTLALLVGVALLASACGSVNRPSGTCAPQAFLDDQEFVSVNAAVHPVPGETLGEIRIPGCNDTGEERDPPDEFRMVARLPGVDPSVAVVDAQIPEVIYVRVDLQPFPQELDRYRTAPGCREGDAPMELAGTWLSIPGTNANIEPDPVPPYSVELLVTDPSVPRYLNAELVVAVPPSLGMPITQDDIEQSLWEGGSLRVTAACDGERFVAESIEVIPPDAT